MISYRGCVYNKGNFTSQMTITSQEIDAKSNLLIHGKVRANLKAFTPRSEANFWKFVI